MFGRELHYIRHYRDIDGLALVALPGSRLSVVLNALMAWTDPLQAAHALLANLDLIDKKC